MPPQQGYNIQTTVSIVIYLRLTQIFCPLINGMNGLLLAHVRGAAEGWEDGRKERRNDVSMVS
jgi:hypothetical protein